MAFHERWFEGPKKRRLAEALALVPAGPGELVEVGSWEGKSSILIAQTFPDSKVHVMDHWLGDLTDLSNGVADLAASRDVFADFWENVTDAGVAHQICVHRADWRISFAEWRHPIRMIFIDGQHTYDEVVDNITQAFPYMVPGGVICGDDFTVKQVGRAVLDVLGPDVEHCKGPGAAIWSYVYD